MVLLSNFGCNVSILILMLLCMLWMQVQPLTLAKCWTQQQQQQVVSSLLPSAFTTTAPTNHAPSTTHSEFIRCTSYCTLSCVYEKRHCCTMNSMCAETRAHAVCFTLSGSRPKSNAVSNPISRYSLCGSFEISNSSQMRPVVFCTSTMQSCFSCRRQHQCWQ